MSGRKMAVGVVLACVLAISGLAAVNASAAATGYTAFTCKSVESNAEYSKAHCKSADAKEGGAGWAHVGFSEKTSITFTNKSTATETTTAQPVILRSTLLGVKVGISCTTASGTGTIENGKEGEEMFVGVVGVITYSGCTVTEPAGKGCAVKGGTITTKEFSATTKGKGMNLEFIPKSGTTFVEITIEGCSVTALNGTFAVAGSLTVPEIEPSGSTLTTTETQVTEAGTLKWGGNKAGIEGSLTMKGPSGEGLAVTTPTYKEWPGPAGKTGYTTFTCKKVEAKSQFTNAHCKSSDAKETEGAGYGHVKFEGSTSITATNANTAAETTASSSAFLKATISGLSTRIGCTTISGSGTLENGLSGEEMFTSGTGTLKYSECIVYEPAEKGCVVKGGGFTTKELAATTKGQGMNVKFTPASGTTFVELTLEGCSVTALNNTYPVTGSVTVSEIEGSGSTFTTTEAEVTTANTLALGGQKAGLETSMTLKGPSGDGLSATTTPWKEWTPPPPPAGGYTTFTCKKVDSGGAFSNAHCKKADAKEGGAYGHVGFSGSTSITATNANTAAETTASSSAFLKATISGVSTRIGCTTISGSGTLENGKEGEEMFTSGTGTLKYSECIVYEPAEKGCVIKGGTLSTNELSATTKGQGMNVKFTPKSGTTFLELTLEGCSVTALNNTYPVTGSVTVSEIEGSGSTFTTTEAEVTTANTLLLGGNKAGLETSMTLKGPSGDGLSATTLPYTEAPKTTGFTAFTCKKVESGGTFSKAHCAQADKGTGYKHVGFGEKTSITGTNANTAAETGAAASAFLKGKIGGVAVGLGCNTVSATGTIENHKEGEEMWVTGTGTITYSGCIVFEPAEKNCVVKGGTITTKELTATTKEQGMGVKFSPKEGTTFAETTIEGCTGEAVPKGTYSATGTLTVPEIQNSGATLSTTESAVTTSGTLKFAGNAAGLETSVTLKGPSGDGISATTPPYTE